MNSTKNVSRIQLIDSDLTQNPHCIHGPTLLFETVANKQRYFACSSCRLRKFCSFYVTFDEWVKDKTSDKYNSKQNSSKKTSKYFYNKSLFESKKSERFFCTNCSQLLFNEQEVECHQNHEITSNISRKDLKNPTKLLNSLSDNKFEAQFLFSTNTTKFIVNQIIKKNNYKSVISIGCPTIHEYIDSRREKLNINSILLDIDERFKQFYSPQNYLKFNLFNNYFFDGLTAEKTFHNFIKESPKESLILIIDPPFGGLIEAIAQTIDKITKIWKQENQIKSDNKLIPMLLFFPYFNENRIISSMPSLSMSDYMVDYCNHNKFKQESGRKFGSPVRIFTNIDFKSIVLPQSEGYHYCDICDKYVSHNNKHCFDCNSCTAKDGKPYKHCYTCKRCVKNTWNHCNGCGYCHLSQQCKRKDNSEESKLDRNKFKKRKK
jgi:hypothetical protein